MFERIEKALGTAGVSVWNIAKNHTRTAELYFIKKKLDLPRFNDILQYEVTVYRDSEAEGNKFRGQSTTYIVPGMTDEEIGRKIADAYFAAQFVKNPFYELPDKVVSPHCGSSSDLKDLPLEDIAEKLAEAALAADCEADAYLNSLEIFVHRKSFEIKASNGLHVSYDTDDVSGEFVTQCKEHGDVEQYREFSYDSLDPDALAAKIKEGLRDARLRANAKEMPASGTYDILITGENIPELFNYYAARASADMLYAGLSTWKIGDVIQGENEGGERLDLTLVADTPFNTEGVPMVDRELVRGGVLQTLFGSTRFCRYMGLEPTGRYRKFRVDCGSVPFAEMQKDGVLETVSFSDFQMDFFDGHFGGEMRLALLHKDGKAVPVCGGSVNGSILDVQGKLIFSKERYKSGTYEGPYAVLIPGIPVAGA